MAVITVISGFDTQTRLTGHSVFCLHAVLSQRNLSVGSTVITAIVAFRNRPHLIFSIWHYYKNAGFWKYY